MRLDCHSCAWAYLCSDIGVAVPVPTHPGAEDKGGAAYGQLPVCVLLQR